MDPATTPAPAETAPGARIVLSRTGLAGRLPLIAGRIAVDPGAGTIRAGGRLLRFRDMRQLEVDRGFLTIGAGPDWLTIDLEAYRDGGGPLVERGAFSPGAVRLVETLKAAIAANREAAAREAGLSDQEMASKLKAGGYGPFDFRYMVRFDRLAVVLTVASAVVILLDLRLITREWLLSLPGLTCFLAFLLIAGGGLWLKRRASGIRFDEEGITVRGPGRTVFYPWKDIREYRWQHGEIEFVGEKFRVPMTLEILTAGGVPIVVRGRHRAKMILPAKLFLYWLKTRIPERPERPIEPTPAEAAVNRWWIGILIAANAALFIAEKPFSGEAFQGRLIEMGARTGNWFREPWRLFTSLFLHGSPSHLFFNMLMLAVLGPWVGRIFGWGRGLVLYLAGGVLGNLIGEILGGLERNHPPAVGASTAILALLGALLAVTYRRPESVPLAARARFRWAIPYALLLTLGLGMVIPVLDNAAHLGGFIAGFAIGWAMPPRES